MELVYFKKPSGMVVKRLEIKKDIYIKAGWTECDKDGKVKSKKKTKK
jgi:hypothetical protein